MILYGHTSKSAKNILALRRQIQQKNYIDVFQEKSLPQINLFSKVEDIWEAHKLLNSFNQTRLSPRTPQAGWQEQIDRDAAYFKLEGQVLEWEICQIRPLAARAPRDPELFMQWYQSLIETGPGQNHPFFNWLEHSADREQMKWLIKQEVAGEAGFDDLTALTQVKLPIQAKLEIARNYWDEMGRGRSDGVHGPMLLKLAEEFNLEQSQTDEVVPESLALGNILLGFAVNRRFTYHSIGALGSVELTAPARAKKVYHALKRLEISQTGQRYYLLHSSLDIKHTEEWNREVISPLIKKQPELIPFIEEGALARLNAGMRCYRRYQSELGLEL